jgi:hypothetical protein
VLEYELDVLCVRVPSRLFSRPDIGVAAANDAPGIAHLKLHHSRAAMPVFAASCVRHDLLRIQHAPNMGLRADSRERRNTPILIIETRDECGIYPCSNYSIAEL